ncbi:hypothetical protein HQ533_00185 [Candidatus Woesearchaeota archaeon]|nr:hypothetical protein [Candidatus Woesearchaeota archaeon]
MAYTELVSFIREQLNAGRDVRTIRDYLIRRNIDQKAVDAAFDEVFGVKSVGSEHGSTEKLILTAVVVLVLAMAGIGAGLYFKLTPESPEIPIVEQPVPPTKPSEPVVPEQKFDQKTVCDFEDPEEKYQCYVLKFDNSEVDCWKIEDDDERDFCYVAQDLYVLSA